MLVGMPCRWQKRARGLCSMLMQSYMANSLLLLLPLTLRLLPLHPKPGLYPLHTL
jgi:hypothetical protein